MSQNLQNFVKFQKFQLENLVDFEKCCKTHIFLQKSAPIQPKTSEVLPKFCQPTLWAPSQGCASRGLRGLRGLVAGSRCRRRDGELRLLRRFPEALPSGLRRRVLSYCFQLLSIDYDWCLVWSDFYRTSSLVLTQSIVMSATKLAIAAGL